MSKLTEKANVKKNFTLGELHLVKELHKMSTGNKEALEAVGEGVCFYCGKTCNPEEITEWHEEVIEKGTTAFCPHCGVDSVIPVYQEFMKSERVISMMMTYWFSSPEDYQSMEKIPERFKEWYVISYAPKD